MVTELALLSEVVAAVPDPARDRLWVIADGAPRLVALELAGGAAAAEVALPSAPAGVALSGDGATLLVALADGTVLTAPADDPADGPGTLATIAAAGLGQAGATRPSSGPGSLVVAATAQDRLLAVALQDGTVRTAAAMPGVTGVATAGTRTWVAATSAGDGRVAAVAGGGTQPVATGLLATGHLSLAPAGDRLWVAHPQADRVSAVEPGAGVTTSAATGVPGRLVEVHELADGRLLLVGADGVAVADSAADLEQRPRLVPFDAPLFVASWAPIRYDLSGSGLTDEEVSFVVADGPDVAIVSATQTVTGTSGKHEPLLAAGGLLGAFRLDMVHTATGDVLDSVHFEVTDHWRDPDHGPSRLFTGDSAPAPAKDWGGGPGTPQNLGTHTHTGTWCVAVLLVDTADGAYPADAAGLAAAKKRILDEVQDGVTVDGTVRSARHYYEELSGWTAGGGGLTVRAHQNQVYGPVKLPEGWGTYFEQGKDASGAVTDERWSSKGATVQTIVTRAITDGVLTTADFSSIDVLLMVPRSPDTVAGTATKRFVWPHAHDGMSFLAGTDVAKDQRTFGFVFVPPDFEVHDGRRVHATLSHELGHTLSLPDLYSFPSYSADVRDRLVTDWDMMGGSRNTMPHYSLSNRMRQGWVRPEHLKLYNFVGSGAVNDSITLHAAELGAPPAGRVRGIEIRLADGWNTYVEYRAKQGPQFSDSLPADRRVVVTDVTSDDFKTPVSRPPVLFVHNDADGDGPILDRGRDYEDLDPSSQKTLQVTVTSTAADNAVVQVKYGSNGRPDPGIRPWSGPPAWKSPDIEVRNARAQADPARWGNTPWAGNMNTVVAKVTNGGDLLAKGVVVDLYAVRFTTGDGPMVLLGTDTHDVAPGATVEFTAPWFPVEEADAHFCIVARIRLYQDPAIAGLFETNIYNDEARSNYFKTISASASPSTRVATEVQLANPFDRRTLVHAVVRQTHRLHRVFADRTWARVDGRSSTPIRVLDEALAGFPETDGPGRERLREELWKEPNRVSVDGWAARPYPADCATPVRTGGATVEVAAGRATIVEIDEATPRSVRGTVRHADDGSPVDDGTVLVVLTEVTEFPQSASTEARVHQGRFETEASLVLPADEQVARAHFLGAYGAAAADSKTVPVR